MVVIIQRERVEFNNDEEKAERGIVKLGFLSLKRRRNIANDYKTYQFYQAQPGEDS